MSGAMAPRPGDGQPRGGHKPKALDALSTIGGVMLSPFRLPPAAKPFGRQASKMRGRSGNSASAIAAKPLFTGAPQAGFTPSASPRAPLNSPPTRGVGATDQAAAPWARGGAGVTPGATGQPTAVIMGSPNVGRPKRDAKLEARRTARQKRHLVDIGTYLWRFGLIRGTLCAGLLLFAIFIPVLFTAPETMPGVNAGTPPFFLQPLADKYQMVAFGCVIAAALGSLLLPMLVRGVVLTLVGMAPFVAFVYLKSTASPPVIPEQLAAYTNLIYILFPAWVGMAAGMVAGQNFPEFWPARLIAGLCAIVVLFYQVINTGALMQAVTNRTTAIEGLLAVLVFALTITAVGQMISGSMLAAISFVKAGLLYILAVPVIFYVFAHAGPAEEQLAAESAYMGLHALIFVMAAFLMAVIGLAELLHFFAFRNEVREKLGKGFVGAKPTTPEFQKQFMVHAEQTGVYSLEELDWLRAQLHT